MPMSVPATLLPIDQLSSGVRRVTPAPYRSPMTRPFHVTTKAAVMPDGGSNAASTASFTFAASREEGSGDSGSLSPIGQGSLSASGSRLLTRTGVKNGDDRPIGSATQPWSPV